MVNIKHETQGHVLKRMVFFKMNFVLWSDHMVRMCTASNNVTTDKIFLGLHEPQKEINLVLLVRPQFWPQMASPCLSTQFIYTSWLLIIFCFFVIFSRDIFKVQVWCYLWLSCFKSEVNSKKEIQEVCGSMAAYWKRHVIPWADYLASENMHLDINLVW